MELPGYDAWKTREPDEHAECDCCGRRRGPLTRIIAYGIETFACKYCLRDPDEKYDAKRNGDLDGP